jgi:hypothetical protein
MKAVAVHKIQKQFKRGICRLSDKNKRYRENYKDKFKLADFEDKTARHSHKSERTMDLHIALSHEYELQPSESKIKTLN